MAQDTGISQSSIYNFIVKLGFDGVQDFKIRVATDTAKKTPVTPSDWKISIFSDLSSEDTTKVLFKFYRIFLLSACRNQLERHG